MVRNFFLPFREKQDEGDLRIRVLLIRWEEERSTDGSKWRFLEHRGPVFAPPYEPLPDKVKFYYDGGSDCISVFMIFPVSPVLNCSIFDSFCRQADETRRSR